MSLSISEIKSPFIRNIVLSKDENGSGTIDTPEETKNVCDYIIGAPKECSLSEENLRAALFSKNFRDAMMKEIPGLDTICQIKIIRHANKLIPDIILQQLDEDGVFFKGIIIVFSDEGKTIKVEKSPNYAGKLP